VVERARTRAADQETVVMGTVGRVLHFFKHIVVVQGEGGVYTYTRVRNGSDLVTQKSTNLG